MSSTRSARRAKFTSLPWLLLSLAGVVLLGALSTVRPRSLPKSTPEPLRALPADVDITLPRIKVTWIAAAFCAVFFCLYAASFPRQLSDRPLFNSPRNNVGYYLTQRFVGGHGFSSPLKHFDDLPDNVRLALTPRDAAEQNGSVVPKDFAGTMLFHAAVYAVAPLLVLFLGPAFAALGGWVIFRVAQLIWSDAPGVFALLGWLAFPPLWINASYVFTGDMQALFLVLVAVLFFLHYLRGDRWLDLAICSCSLSLAMLFRYPDALLLVPFGVALAVAKRVRPLHLLAAAGAALPALGILLAFNALVYGDPLTTGFQLGEALLANTVNFSGESLLKFRPAVVWRYVQTYGIDAPLISLPFVVGVAAALVCTRRGGRLASLSLVTLGTFLVLGAYYSGKDAWGITSFQLNASVLRYMLPAFALSYVFLGKAAYELARRVPSVSRSALILFVVISGYYSLVGPSGVLSGYRSIEQQQDLRTQVLAATESDSIVASRLMDKALYPERQTLTLTYTIHNETPVAKGDRQTYDFVPDPERFATVSVAIHDAHVPFYLLADGSQQPLADYQSELKARGLYLRAVSDVSAGHLFKIVALKDLGS